MERRALMLKTMIKEHSLKKEHLDPRRWMQQETDRGFTDSGLNKHPERETDNSFDNKDSCECTRTMKQKKWGEKIGGGLYTENIRSNFVEKSLKQAFSYFLLYIVTL